MKGWPKKILNTQTGYTLAEVASVAIIIGAIAFMALPNFTTSSEKVQSSEGVQIISAVWKANQLFILENDGAGATNLNQLQVDFPAGGGFNAPTMNPAAGQTARIDRASGLYRLYISDAGDVTCDDDGFAGAQNGLCARMGYAAYD